MGGPSLAADLLHFCIGPHRRNKAIKKGQLLGIFVSQSTGSEYRNSLDCKGHIEAVTHFQG